MSRPSGSVEAGRRAICTVGSSTGLRKRRQEPCSRCSEQDRPQPLSIERVGGPSTGTGGRLMSRLRPRDGSKSILVPDIAKEKARSHGVELKIIRRWKSFKTRRPSLRIRPTDSMAFDSRWVRPSHPRARVTLPARALRCADVYGFWITVRPKKGWRQGRDAMVSSDKQTWRMTNGSDVSRRGQFTVVKPVTEDRLCLRDSSRWKDSGLSETTGEPGWLHGHGKPDERVTAVI